MIICATSDAALAARRTPDPVAPPHRPPERARGRGTADQAALADRAARLRRHPLPRPAPALQQELTAQLEQRFPDIRRAAKQAIEARLKTDYDLTLDADHVFYNYFNPSLQTDPPLRSLGDGAFEGRTPSRSMTLADAQLWALTLRTPSPPADQVRPNEGIYTDGGWATSFGPHNKLPLSAAQFLHAASRSGLLEQYGDALQTFLDDHAGALATLAELRAFDYAQTHRRAGQRAAALGVNGGDELSDLAVAMLASASGRHDPDLPLAPVDVLRFDINGYASEDIVWLRHASGRIVLVIPDSPYPPLELRDLGDLRQAIREIISTPPGRAILASHFSRYNRRNGTFYDGVDSWLRTLADDHGRHYDYAIARAPAATDRLHLAPPTEQARALLSDRALAMLAQAAQAGGEPGRALQLQSHLFDIAGVASIDMVWLRAADGRVVLLMPGDAQPVREYADPDAMRADVLALLSDATGRARVTRHFRDEDLADGQHPKGVARWIDDIVRHPELNRDVIAHDPVAHVIQGNVFALQANRRHQHQLAQLEAVRATDWQSHDIDNAARGQWRTPFELEQQPFHAQPASRTLCDTPIGLGTTLDAQGQVTCQRNGQTAGSWARALAQRLALYHAALEQDR